MCRFHAAVALGIVLVHVLLLRHYWLLVLESTSSSFLSVLIPISGPVLLHLLGPMTMLPFNWALVQQSMVALLLLDHTHNLCMQHGTELLNGTLSAATQEMFTRVLPGFLTGFGSKLSVEDICLDYYQAAVIFLGFIPSCWRIFKHQLGMRKRFAQHRKVELLLYPEPWEVFPHLVLPLVIMGGYILISC